ncbi:hypothetical protein BUALT_Bualt09G0100300 [Buddleja alternifolia]|uniref:40S ribosomal protein S17 n=1 Tax=Buddleja alternifolia TaxID=168488 RepID=A0AAV6X9X5_9LAMI|nr:hypothetical protein BUALT_Bualt09G0100300 [Buddleja alternifolia]
MGRVRTKTVKKSSRQVIERYYSKMTLDFHTNKKILEEVAIIPSKRLRNKIAGFSTHLMKRIQKGPVRGISLKLQEEERERRMDFVPDESAIKVDRIEVDQETIDLLESLGMKEMPGVVLREDQVFVDELVIDFVAMPILLFTCLRFVLSYLSRIFTCNLNYWTSALLNRIMLMLLSALSVESFILRASTFALCNLLLLLSP